MVVLILLWIDVVSVVLWIEVTAVVLCTVHTRLWREVLLSLWQPNITVGGFRDLWKQVRANIKIIRRTCHVGLNSNQALKLIKIILERRVTCRLHRVTSKMWVLGRARDREVSPIVQHEFVLFWWLSMKTTFCLFSYIILVVFAKHPWIKRTYQLMCEIKTTH
jgi:ABC-type multidrug transport system permease subunit